MSRQERIPRVENVDLVPESRSRGGAPGFNFHFNLVLAVALLAVIALSYIVFY
jgi:hypothetical protein